jgi:eukaryotic-like serine/threonine-protein kinase
VSEYRTTEHDPLRPSAAPPAPRGEDETRAGSDLLGAVLAGRYRILEKLGEGAMGTVYLGEHLKIGRRDAIKVLRDALASDAEALARFNRGARNVAAIRHPNICTIYDYSDAPGGLQFMAMEYVPGETLKDRLDREGSLPLDRTAAIIAQVAAALDAAHEVGIVHRDLKPGNIMLTPGRDGEESVRVVDFDLAKSEISDGAEVTRFGFVVGTPEYMSPEQLTGDALDGRSDVYSLALVFLRTLTGSLPIRAATTQELIVKRLTEAPLPLAELGWEGPNRDALQAVLERALERDAARRTASARAFALELAQALAADEPGAARSTPRPAPGPGPVAETLPETRLSPVTPPSAPAVPPTVVVPAARRPDVPARRPAWQRPAVLAGVGAGLLLLALGALSIPRAGPDAAATEPTAVRPPATDAVATADLPADDAPPTDAPAQEAGARVVPGGTPGRDAAPVSAALVPPAPEPPAPRAEPGLTVATGAAVLDRLVSRVVPPFPARAELRAIQDSAERVFALPGASAELRGRAAFVVGSALHAMDELRECERWLRRALDLRPSDSGARFLLTQCESEP